MDFYLTALDNDINVDKATISAEDFSQDPNNNPKAVAELYVDVDELQSVFKYATNAADLTDVSAEDMYFFVDAEGFKNLVVQTTSCINADSNTGTLADGTLFEQIGRAWVSGVKNTNIANKTGIDFDKDANNSLYTVDNKGLLKDLFRDLANQMFGTQYGVDIIQNESDLCNNTFTSTSELFVGPNGNVWKALDDASGLSVGTATSANIGRVIFNNIVSNDSERLQDICSNYLSDISMNVNDNLNGSGSNGNNTEMRLYKMPFEAGDTLRFHLNYVYDVNQWGVVNNGVSSQTLQDRLYEVVLKLI